MGPRLPQSQTQVNIRSKNGNRSAGAPQKPGVDIRHPAAYKRKIRKIPGKIIKNPEELRLKPAFVRQEVPPCVEEFPSSIARARVRAAENCTSPSKAADRKPR